MRKEPILIGEKNYSEPLGLKLEEHILLQNPRGQKTDKPKNDFKMAPILNHISQ